MNYHLKINFSIYYPLYDGKIEYLKEQFYPGNDSKYNKVYSSIINHFKFKPKDGCYACLCEKGFYHCVKAGFPGYKFLNMKCPKCSKPIGITKQGIIGFFIQRKL